METIYHRNEYRYGFDHGASDTVVISRDEYEYEKKHSQITVSEAQELIEFNSYVKEVMQLDSGPKIVDIFFGTV